MASLPNSYYRIYVRVRHSMAFVPSIIGTLFFLAALLVNAIEYLAPISKLKEAISFALVTDVATARTVLAILIGGLISLTVFSFSMVMLSINQASATLSPAVVPALIADPLRQKILGIYIGTITFYLTITLNMNPLDYQSKVPQLGILMCYLLAILCITLFVYFISSITRSLQVDTILQDLYDQTLSQLKQKTTTDHSSELDDSIQDLLSEEGWSAVKTVQPGYFKSVNKNQLLDLMTENDVSVSLQVRRGEFAVVGEPVLKVSKELDEEKQQELAECFVFYMEEFAEEHYSYGIKHISQIGVKALSPGINDPMTAIKCIQLLSLLLIEATPVESFEIIETETAEPYCRIPEYTLADLVFLAIAPLCKYAQTDAQTLIALFTLMKSLIVSARDEKDQDMLGNFARCLADDVHTNIKNAVDRNHIDHQINTINHLSERVDKSAIPLLAER